MLGILAIEKYPAIAMANIRLPIIIKIVSRCNLGMSQKPALNVPITLPKVENMKMVPADKPICRSPES